MSTKEDILEQLAEEYFAMKGYFIQHNVKFRPSKNHPDFISRQDSNHSDIDVLAFHPQKDGPEAVMAVSCKSWQKGFSPKRELDAIKHNKVLSGRERWRFFRELCVPKWSDAFCQKIEQMTGRKTFCHVTAVSTINDDRSAWETHMPFIHAMNGNPVKLLAFNEMVEDIQSQLTTTLASTEVGRMLQMFRAAGIDIGSENNARSSD